MPTPRKEGIVEDLTAKLKRAKALVLVEIQGLKTADQIILRKKLRENNLEFQVVKNTLFRLSTHQTESANLDKILAGPTAVAFGYDDEIAVAKAVSDYVRTSKIVKIKAGMLGKTAMSAAQVEDLAKLPGRDGVRSQSVGTLLGPAQKVVGLLSAPMRDLVGVLHNYAEKQGATF
jgi:large subunit ribosomal protein L10